MPAPGSRQRLAFRVMTRMMAGAIRQAYGSLGAALAAATATTPADRSAPGRNER